MKTKTFILKFLRLISLILLLSTLLVLVVKTKIKTLFIKIECQKTSIEGDIHFQINVPLFYFMQVFLLHTYYHNNYLLTSDFTTGKVKILRNYSRVVVISKYL